MVLAFTMFNNRIALQLPTDTHMSLVHQHEMPQPNEADLLMLSPEATERRKRQFSLGREAARRALELAGFDPVSVGRSKSGHPIWPKGLAGSISHSAELAVAIVNTSGVAVGVDIQEIRPTKSELMGRVANEKEAENTGLTALEIFSIKEAVYKSLAAESQKGVGFHEIKLNQTDGVLRGELLRNSSLGIKVILSHLDNYILSVAITDK